MSLILEALRKSEAERRRAQVPDLLAEPQAAAPIVKRAPSRWPLVAAGAVVVFGASWFVLRPSAPPAVAVAAEEVAPATTEAEPVPAQATPQPVSRPANLRRPLVVAAPAPAVPATTHAMPAPMPPPPQRVQVASAPVPPPARAEAPPPPVASPAPAFDPVERITDLGNDERKQLPPLKLSMHMWNDVATRRFVIIDGTRLTVGDRLGALVVADIVPDGVLLDWNGRALKLPLR